MKLYIFKKIHFLSTYFFNPTKHWMKENYFFFLCFLPNTNTLMERNYIFIIFFYSFNLSSIFPILFSNSSHFAMAGHEVICLHTNWNPLIHCCHIKPKQNEEENNNDSQNSSFKRNKGWGSRVGWRSICHPTHVQVLGANNKWKAVTSKGNFLNWHHW